MGGMTNPAPEALEPPVPTQVKQPWRTTVRSVFQALLSFLIIVPIIVQTAGLDPEVYPWLGGVLAVIAAIVRVMALPQVEDFLRNYVSFLAAQPPETPRRARVAARRAERGAVSTRTIAIAAAIGVVILLIVVFFNVSVSTR